MRRKRQLRDLQERDNVRLCVDNCEVEVSDRWGGMFNNLAVPELNSITLELTAVATPPLVGRYCT